MVNIETLYPVRDIYKNIPGKGKIKILTKDKGYSSLNGNYIGLKIKIINDDLGNQFIIKKGKQFYTKVRRRDNIIRQLLA